jgi:hypothetical protein
MLCYRGNYSLTAGIDFGGTMLSAEYGGGYREDEVIFPPLRYWKLTYSALHKHVKVRLPNGEMIDRLSYVWQMYYNSKNTGNQPFILRCPRDKKIYLAYFPDDTLEVEMMDMFLGTTGLSIKQVNVRGITTNADGSLNEGITYADSL